MQTKTRFLLSMATTLGLATAVHADDEAMAAMQARMAAMEAELNRLRDRDDDRWLTEQRAAEIRSLVQDVLMDADTRASLLQGGATAGYDDGFFLADADGDYRLEVGGQFQFRWVYNTLDGDDDLPAGDVDDDVAGFEVRRMKLNFAGYVFDESWEYDFTGAFGRGDGVFELEDAFIQKNFEDRDLFLRMGQFKAPVLREELVSSKRQLTVDRSLVLEEFTAGRTQGILLGALYENFGWQVSYNDGIDEDNSAALAGDTEWAFSGRGEVLLAGDWRQFRDFTSWTEEDFGAMLGFAGHFQNGEYGTSDEEVETFLGTVDLSLEFGGANAFAALIYRQEDVDVALGDDESVDQWAFVVQGGVFVVPDEWEVFARYEHGDLDDDELEELNVVTAGVNRYWYKHALKFTGDVGYAFDEVEGFGSSGVGWRDASDEGQLVVRTQVQLIF